MTDTITDPDTFPGWTFVECEGGWLIEKDDEQAGFGLAWPTAADAREALSKFHARFNALRSWDEIIAEHGNSVTAWRDGQLGQARVITWMTVVVGLPPPWEPQPRPSHTIIAEQRAAIGQLMAAGHSLTTDEWAEAVAVARRAVGSDHGQ